ncbi:MAG TPA: glycosyltransferase family 2 protein [Polyangiales bacterium]|nr:glycosyltransferase family 2 protein [Polyangiales bacterium]
MRSWAAGRQLRLTIIVDNYNYARYLPYSIEAALAVRWPNKEVLVVDDGSADDSRTVIERYADRVTPLFKPNGGLNSAANLAFAHSTGDVVMFCDADDELFDSVGERVMERWHDGVSKVQFGQYKIDERGERIGPAWPVFTERNTPEWARRTIARCGSYDAPPTSGSAWSRRFLERVFPLPTKRPGDPGRWGMWFDDYLNALAPFFGDVISLTEPQGNYRIHGRNAAGGIAFSPEYLAELCVEETLRTLAVNDVLAKRPGSPRVDIELFYEHLKHRLIYKRLLPERYGYGDSTRALFTKYSRATLRGDLSNRSKAMMLAWGAVMALAPRELAWVAARAKQEPGSRSALLQELWARVTRRSWPA